MSQHLVLFDADRIKDFVFATGRLRDIRGASALVRSLTDDPLATARRGGWQGSDPDVLYAAGAAGALLFANGDEASRFCGALEQAYGTETVAATLTAAAELVDGNDIAGTQRRAARALAARKAARSQSLDLPGGGYVRFCAADRLFPAVGITRAPETALVSAPTVARRRHNSRSWKDERWWATFRGHPRIAGGAWDNLERAGDLNAIGEQSTPGGYIAFVHADGDGIGRVIRTVLQAEGTFDAYRRVSAALSGSAHAATGGALSEAYGDAFQTGETLPFEVIAVGGDDVLLICTAERGLHVACALDRLFAEHMRAAGFDGLSASVGVVIAHASHPIANLQQRAAELLKSAKKQAGAGVGGIDFAVASTPGLAPLAEARADLPMARPFRRSDAEVLLRYARELRSFPASKRAQLYEALTSGAGRVAVTLDVLRVQSRLPKEERETLLSALFALGASELYPFVADTQRRADVTPLYDLIEAAEFVVPKTEGGGVAEATEGAV